MRSIQASCHFRHTELFKHTSLHCPTRYPLTPGQGLFQKLSSSGGYIFFQTPPPPGHTWSQSPLTLRTVLWTRPLTLRTCPTMDQIHLDPQDKLTPPIPWTGLVRENPHPSDTLSTKHPPPTGQKSACGPPTPPEDNFWNSPKESALVGKVPCLGAQPWSILQPSWGSNPWSLTCKSWACYHWAMMPHSRPIKCLHNSRPIKCLHNSRPIKCLYNSRPIKCLWLWNCSVHQILVFFEWEEMHSNAFVTKKLWEKG